MSGEQPGKETESDLPSRKRQAIRVTSEFHRRRSQRQKQRDDGDRQSVIESALDVDRLTDSHRDPLVRDDGLTEGGVRRGQNGPEQCGLHQGETRKEQDGEPRSEPNGER